MKTASEFEVEKEVCLISNKQKRGTVIGNKLSDGDQVIAVEWQDGTLAKVNCNDVQICLSMEEEFALIQEQVNAKLAEAARLIREANALAVGHDPKLDLQSTDDEYGEYLFDHYVIEHAMGDAGWRTSSWNC